MSDKNPFIKLTHPHSKEHIIEFDPLDRENKWIERVLFLPWTTPTRLVGFVHPEAEKEIGSQPFALFAAFSYYGSVMMQKAGDKGLQVSEGPKVVIPYDLMGPIDLHIGKNCPSWMFIREQDEAIQKFFTGMLLENIMPRKIEVPQKTLLVPGS